MDGVARDEGLLHLERDLSQRRVDGLVSARTQTNAVGENRLHAKGGRRVVGPIPMRAVPWLASLQHGQSDGRRSKPSVLIHERRQDGRRADEGRVVLGDQVSRLKYTARFVEFGQKGCGPKNATPLSLPLSHAVLSGDGPSVGVIHRAQERHALLSSG